MFGLQQSPRTRIPTTVYLYSLRDISNDAAPSLCSVSYSTATTPLHNRPQPLCSITNMTISDPTLEISASAYSRLDHYSEVHRRGLLNLIRLRGLVVDHRTSLCLLINLAVDVQSTHRLRLEKVCDEASWHGVMVCLVLLRPDRNSDRLAAKSRDELVRRLRAVVAASKVRKLPMIH
jgi:hypothetical protein